MTTDIQPLIPESGEIANIAAANNNASKSSTNYNRVKIALSDPRLERYRVLANNDIEKAIALHHWNAEVAASTMPALHVAEILVRNLALQRVINNFGKNWYDNVDFHNRLKVGLREKLKEQVSDEKTAGRIGNLTNYVANEMTFGFWSNLYSSSFHSKLWGVDLSRIRTTIDRSLTVSALQQKIDKVKTFRNNVAHHKNLICKPTDVNYSMTIELIGDICAATKGLVEEKSIFSTTWENPPIPRENWGS
ncbi:Abi family protein [Agrobacterium sp. 22-223-1]